MVKDKNNSFGLIGEIFPIEEQKTYEIQFDKIRIRLKKRNKIWYIWNTRIENSQFKFDEINYPEITRDLGWEQFVVKSKNNLTVKPLMPDKSIVLRPDSSILSCRGKRLNILSVFPFGWECI